MKLTEDEVVQILKDYLEAGGWHVGERFCLGFTHGIDIEAHKGDEILMIEAKGARANDNAPSKRREYFNTGQIKTHFGKAIVKILEDKHRNPNAFFAIAHPDDINVRHAIEHLIPFLSVLGIKHFWVSKEKIIEQ